MRFSRERIERKVMNNAWPMDDLCNAKIDAIDGLHIAKIPPFGTRPNNKCYQLRRFVSRCVLAPVKRKFYIADLPL